MKYFSHSLHLVLTCFIVSFCLIFLCFSLAACSAKRSVIKSVSESATASVSDSRRTFYRTLDSLSREFSLSFDSASIIFFGPESQEFPREFPSKMESLMETPFDSTSLASQPPYSRASCASFTPRQRNASRFSVAQSTAQVPSYLLRPQVPTALKVYGLHLTARSEEKSAASADLKDSVTVATQSQNLKSAHSDKSAPASAPQYILPIILLTIVLYTIHRLRRPPKA